MALFGSHWNEDDRIPQERGLRAKMPIFEDNWEDGWKEVSDQIRRYFETEKYKETYEKVTSALNAKMLNDLRPKMHWVQKSTPYAPAARWYCSNCGNDEMYKTPFCPICGAMEVKDD